MEEIEERAYKAVPDTLRINDNYVASFVIGYCQCATEQHKIDIDKAHDWLMAHYREYFALRKPIKQFEQDFMNAMTTEK